MSLTSGGVDRDSGGESERRALAGRDILSLCLSRLEPHVPIHLHCPDPPRLTVQLTSALTNFKRPTSFRTLFRTEAQLLLYLGGFRLLAGLLWRDLTVVVFQKGKTPKDAQTLGLVHLN